MASVLLSSWPTCTVRADEISELKEQLRIQSEILKQLQQKVADLEARQKLRERSLAQKVTDLEASQELKEQSLTERIEAVAQKTEAVALKTEKMETMRLPTSADWTQRIKWSGDFRYRHEQIDEEKVGSVRWHDGETRHRIRVRLMLEAIINDEWDVAFRIATGGPGGDPPHDGDPTSTNQDLENAFSSKSIWLDLAFFRWHPAAMERLNVFGGKIKNPFYKVGANQLIWDSDVNPEGIAVQIERPLGNACALFINGGGFWVDEIHSSTLSADGADISLWGIQGYVKHNVSDPDYILAGASWFDYANLKGRSPLSSTWGGGSKWFGNTTSGGYYASDYDLLEVFAEYGTEWAALGGLPVTVFGDYVQNTAATTAQDEGWLAGIRINRAKEPGSWEFLYNYRQLEADAVVGQFSDSDFVGGGTDGRGHKFGCTYQVRKNTQMALTYLHNEDDTGSNGRDLDYRRFQADLKLKFK